MYFALWALGAAATFLYGCYSKQESDDKNSSTFRNRQVHTIPSPPKQAQPTRPYIREFGNNLKAEQAYQNLITEGVKPAQLDIGCRFPKTSTIGADDHRVEPCEVDEFLFSNYQKYKKIFESRTQESIPWKLDEITTQKVNKVIQQLKDCEALKGISPSSDGYTEKLATALYHFALFPDYPAYLQKNHSEWKKRSSELKSLGLENFQKKLLAEGGLGVSLWRNDNQGVTDGNVSEALQKKIGSESAKIHLLFSIFEQAGLQPFFAKVDLIQENSPIEENIQQGKDIPVYRTSRFLVGVSLHQNEKVYDLSQFSLIETPRQYEKLSLKIYYSYYLSKRGANATKYNRHQQAIELFEKALEFNPKSHTTHNAYGALLMLRGNRDLAELSFKKSILLNPRYHLAFENLGDLYWEQDKKTEALQSYYDAISANPRWMKTFAKDKLWERTEKVLRKDPYDVTAKTIRQKLDNISLVTKH